MIYYDSIKHDLFVFMPHRDYFYYYQGMKALVLDPTTTKIVSMVYSQTQILEQEVYLVEVLGKRHEPMQHLKAAVFIQPTEANLKLLFSELKQPKFAEYHIFFSNVVPTDMLQRLGRADEHEIVRQVQEYYADFMAINEDFFQLGIDNSLVLSSASRTLESGQIFDRNLNGVLSVLLALKRRPSQIRYQTSGSSNLARRMATEILNKIETDEIFEFRRQEGPMLMILDRRDDPITPLLTQWTYQAMVHELLGLNNNRVLLKGAPNITKDLEEVVLSCSSDEFFSRNRYANFGDLGNSIKNLLDEYQKKSKMNENISSIEDMQAFMERFPAFRSQAINVSKHVALMGELWRLVDNYKLLDISQLEQEIACSNDHSNHKTELLDKLDNAEVKSADKLRLALLYIIRYESYNEVASIKSKLCERGVSDRDSATLDAILEYAGEAKRSPGLLSSGGFLKSIGKTFGAGLNGVENVYTQHQPLLSNLLDNIAKGKVKDSVYPLVSSSGPSRPSEFIVFMIGGATYEEALKVAEFNQVNPGLKVILGGSCIQNSVSFLSEIVSVFGH